MSNVKTLFSRKYLKKIRIYRNTYCNNNNNNCNDKNGVIEKNIVRNFSKKYIYENICWMCCSITPGIMSFIFLILNWILHKPIKDKFNKETTLPEHAYWITARSAGVWSHERKLEALKRFL